VRQRRIWPIQVWCGIVLSVHHLEITEDTIYDTQSGFRVRVPLVVPESHDGTSAGDRLEHCLVGFVADVLALDREAEGPGAEVSLVPEFGDNQLHPLENSGTVS